MAHPQVKTEKHEYDWGIIVNFRHNTSKGKRGEENPLTSEAVILVDILLHVKKTSEDDTDSRVPCPPGEVRINSKRNNK